MQKLVKPMEAADQPKNIAQVSPSGSDTSPKFVYRAWYCGAWADELGDNLLARRILNEPIVMFRDEQGAAHAISDICPHKFAPLHLGKHLGNTVQCPYHGLEFDGSGRCMHNPHGDGKVPGAAKVRSFPLLEKWGVLWIWMDPDFAPDESLLPDFSQLTDPGRRTIKGMTHVKGNYQHSLDNLMDLGHAMYLHQASVGTTGTMPKVEQKVVQDGKSVSDLRLYRNMMAPRFYAQHFPDPSREMDFWSDVQWFPVSLARNFVGAAYPGNARTADSVNQLGAHFLTPETHKSSHYFFANSRNYALDDAAADAAWVTWQETALSKEDSSMVEAIQQYEADVERLGMRPVLLTVDAAGMRVRRLIQQMTESA
ncbi:aromatic ring-hydroxylating dioxygenase subunit alpha [Pusillimonas sp.]|uniref:aromatic ring-hydroxylating dioxygenase subunit alpha n=1 Tax=Pusillimonas sp. TaxID=3040095 RepID=UPI0029B4AE3E|nr:aromatic ring-hydroxylating dioxygenase subunit alpha [Pusillimonas sp.]MDX3895570.1 aromatic ring-hydroxylating dioxygenase subunit alpha [Pusillimonas sp.]